MQRSAANCPPLSWAGSVISLFWKQKTDNLRAYVVRFRIYAHMWQAVNHSLCKANICLWSTLSNSLSVWMYLFCLLCMYNMSMYICIRMLCTVGTGVLICSIIVLYLLYWIKNNIKTTTKTTTAPTLPKYIHPRSADCIFVKVMFIQPVWFVHIGYMGHSCFSDSIVNQTAPTLPDIYTHVQFIAFLSLWCCLYSLFDLFT